MNETLIFWLFQNFVIVNNRSKVKLRLMNTFAKQIYRFLEQQISEGSTNPIDILMIAN